MGPHMIHILLLVRRLPSHRHKRDECGCSGRVATLLPSLNIRRLPTSDSSPSIQEQCGSWKSRNKGGDKGGRIGRNDRRFGPIVRLEEQFLTPTHPQSLGVGGPEVSFNFSTLPESVARVVDTIGHG